MNFLYKNKTDKFLFIDKNHQIHAFLLKEKQIKEIGFCNKLEEFDDFLENLRKKYPQIVKSKNIFITNFAKLENLEKGPLNKQELFNYVSWKLKEKIDVPMIDVAYSFIANEKPSIEFFKKNLQTVYIRKNYLQNIEKIFKNHKIKLFAFDYIKTAFIDVIKKIYEEKKFNRPIAILNLEQDNVYLDIYEKDGLILSRNFEFIQIDNHSSENEKKETLEKLVLGIQRSLDYMDRTLSLSSFENIIFLGDAQELKNEIINYFSLKEIMINDLLNIELETNENNIDSNFIKILSCRGQYSDEQINLLEKEEESSFLKDFKNLILFLALISLGMSIIGGIYEWKAKSLEQNSQQVQKENENIQKMIKRLKNNKQTISPQLEKEIFSLNQTKVQIINMLNQKNSFHNDIFSKFLYQLAFIATKNQMFLSDIEFSQNNLILKGVSLTKINFQNFLDDLKKSKLFATTQIEKIQIHENENHQFDFIISSNVGSHS